MKGRGADGARLRCAHDAAPGRRAGSLPERADNIQKATAHERTGDVVLTYRGSRKDARRLPHDSRNQSGISGKDGRSCGRTGVPKGVPARAHRGGLYGVAPIAFIWKGVRCLLHRKLEVEVLDALSITASSCGGLQHRRVGDVPADGEQPAGRVDKEKELG